MAGNIEFGHLSFGWCWILCNSNPCVFSIVWNVSSDGVSRDDLTPFDESCITYETPAPPGPPVWGEAIKEQASREIFIPISSPDTGNNYFILRNYSYTELIQFINKIVMFSLWCYLWRRGCYSIRERGRRSPLMLMPLFIHPKAAFRNSNVSGILEYPLEFII